MKRVVDELSAHFGADDDLALWLAVLLFVNGDISRRLSESESTRDLLLLVGSCSKWLRPHQTRFRIQDEHYAWPSGYSGVGFSRTGLPEFDWCCCFRRDDSDYMRIDVPHKVAKRQHLVRVVIPTQTRKRTRASINVFWTPGTPADRRQPLVQLLAFHKTGDQWDLKGGVTLDGNNWAGEVIPPPSRRLQRTRG